MLMQRGMNLWMLSGYPAFPCLRILSSCGRGCLNLDIHFKSCVNWRTERKFDWKCGTSKQEENWVIHAVDTRRTRFPRMISWYTWSSLRMERGTWECIFWCEEMTWIFPSVDNLLVNGCWWYKVKARIQRWNRRGNSFWWTTHESELYPGGFTP